MKKNTALKCHIEDLRLIYTECTGLSDKVYYTHKKEMNVGKFIDFDFDALVLAGDDLDKMRTKDTLADIIKRKS